MINLLAALVLIIAQGIFTAGETGFLSVEKVMVAKAKKENKRWAKNMSYFLATPERFFSTILVSEDFMLVIASTLCAQFFVGHFGEHWAIVSTILVALISLTIGQFIPKSIALANPYATVTLLGEIIFYTEILTYPVVSLFAALSRGIAHLYKGARKKDVIRRLDIVHAISEYEKKTSKLAIRLFNFPRITVADIMIPLDRVFLCAQGTELETIRNARDKIYTRIPVYDKVVENIIGIFNIKDYFYTDQIVLRTPLFVNLNERGVAIFSLMKQKGEHMAIVRDGSRVLGIVTLEDLIEELVGEIRDER